MKNALLLAVLLQASQKQQSLLLVQAHTRLECPPPRSGETGQKIGPCDAPDDLSLPAYPLMPGALNTISWLESIPHPGAPARFALSLDGDDSAESFETCLLLDHVPHDAYSLPNIMDETSWHRSSITLWIPDVSCDRCHLQLLTVMSDEVHGVPADTSCVYGGALASNNSTVTDASLTACPVVYHSCSPVSINGTIPRNEITTCNTTEFEQELDWPMTPHDSDVGLYDYSTYYYKGNPGLYNTSTSRLMAVGAPIDAECTNLAFCDPAEHFDMTLAVPDDANYAAMAGTCAAMATMEVEAFELGVLPSTPKNTTAGGDFVAPANGGACVPCVAMEQCFTDGCILRDITTGNWSGPAAACNDFGAGCAPCFPDSPCIDYGTGATATESDSSNAATEDNDPETNATTDTSGSMVYLLVGKAIAVALLTTALMVMVTIMD